MTLEFSRIYLRIFQTTQYNVTACNKIDTFLSFERKERNTFKFKQQKIEHRVLVVERNGYNRTILIFSRKTEVTWRYVALYRSDFYLTTFFLISRKIHRDTWR